MPFNSPPQWFICLFHGVYLPNVRKVSFCNGNHLHPRPRPIRGRPLLEGPHQGPGLDIRRSGGGHQFLRPQLNGVPRRGGADQLEHDRRRPRPQATGGVRGQGRRIHPGDAKPVLHPRRA